MEHERIDELIADALGDELGSAGADELRSAIENDAAAADELRSLERTVAAMRALSGPAPAPVPRARRRLTDPMLRYAAVIALAFTAGLLARGGAPAGVEAPPEAARPAGDHGGWTDRAGRGYVGAVEHSGFARSLIAVAEAVRGDADAARR